MSILKSFLTVLNEKNQRKYKTKPKQIQNPQATVNVYKCWFNLSTGKRKQKPKLMNQKSRNQ